MTEELDNTHYPFTSIHNSLIESFYDPRILGIYIYLKMVVETETQVTEELIEKIMRKFNLEYDAVELLLILFEKKGLLFIANKTY